MQDLQCIAPVWVVSLCIAVNPAQAVVIDFDDLSSGSIVSNQYPEAIFSAASGDNTVTSFDDPNTLPNVICTSGCIVDTYIDFTNPVEDLTFYAIAANIAGNTADFNVYVNGAFDTKVSFISTGGLFNNQFVDLSSFTNVTRLEIVNILDDPVNENGIGWDTFSFSVVPEPTSAAIVGIAGFLLLRQHRRHY